MAPGKSPGALERARLRATLLALSQRATIRDRYGIHMPVLFDPSGALQSALGVPANEVHVVLTEGARIHWVGQYAARQVATRIESAY